MIFLTKSVNGMSSYLLVFQQSKKIFIKAKLFLDVVGRQNFSGQR